MNRKTRKLRENKETKLYEFLSFGFEKLLHILRCDLVRDTVDRVPPSV